ncbi:MAG: agmatine deiminase family protein [bacterium]|nr:agmatine deiminase family protein [bacterium]
MDSELSEYRWPAEWEPHSHTLLTWPQRPELWSGRIAAVHAAYLEIIRTLSEDEAVRILVNDARTADTLRSLLRGNDIPCGPDAAVDLWVIPTNDVWIRDYGPLRLLRNDSATPASRMIAYTFTGWGEKFPADADNQAAGAVADRCNESFEKYSDFVLEGGAIESNGRGLLMTTEACLLHPNRNPRMNRDEIEARLKQTLGAHSVLWLPHGLPGDDTDGHVDMLARFVGENHVISCLPEDESHPAYADLAMNLAHLRAFRTHDGDALRVDTLPLPPLRLSPDGLPIPESHANFYIGNGSVLVPVFNDAHTNGIALRTLQRIFPDRRVVGIPGADLILEGGGVHCMTMQIAG